MAAWAAVAAAVIGTGVSYASAQRSASMQEAGMRQAQKNADAQAAQADQAANAANRKKPDTSAIMDAAMSAGKQGSYGTMLTGPGGVDTSALNLGKTSLLG